MISRPMRPLLALLLPARPRRARASRARCSERRCPAGAGTLERLADRPGPERRLDGRLRDWPGALAPFAGATVHRRGALTYRDHITDAYGADNGQDTVRLGLLDPAAEEIPELFRLDPAYQYVPGEFGVPTGPLDPRVHYGDLPHVDEADLSEVRLGTDATRNLWLLARTTTMADDEPAPRCSSCSTPRRARPPATVPYNSGLTTTVGDVAVYLGPEGASATDLATGDGATAAGRPSTARSGYAQRHRGAHRTIDGVDASPSPRASPAATASSRRSTCSPTSPTSPSARPSRPATGGTSSRASTSSAAPSTASSPTSRPRPARPRRAGALRARSRLPRPHLPLGSADLRGGRRGRRPAALRRLPAHELPRRPAVARPVVVPLPRRQRPHRRRRRAGDLRGHGRGAQRRRDHAGRARRARLVRRPAATSTTSRSTATSTGC